MADFYDVREKRQILRMCLEILMKNLGVRRSLRSLHEFSFAHQVVRILLRKNKKTRDVGLLQVPLSLHCCATATPPCVSEATEKVPITAFLSIFSVTLFKNYRKRTLKILRSEVFQWPLQSLICCVSCQEKKAGKIIRQFTNSYILG